jgi:hypothetical protein
MFWRIVVRMLDGSICPMQDVLEINDTHAGRAQDMDIQGSTRIATRGKRQVSK